MVMYSFVHSLREAKFCGVPSCVFDKLGCAAGAKRLRNTALDDKDGMHIALIAYRNSVILQNF
jgi:hypothetical protein